MIVTVQSCPTESPGYSQALPGLEESAEVARQLVHKALEAWSLGHLSDSGVLLVTELVANAVKHTNTRSITVLVCRPSARFVRIGVIDQARVIPEMVKPGADLLTSGRGLLLIDGLADRWGTDMYSWGKQVWAELLTGPAA